MYKRTTIKDIAKKLNISPSTVSRALSDHPDINIETIERVKTAAIELEYFPNSVAQSLQKKHANIIGVLVPEIKHDFFSSAIGGIESVVYNAGYAIIVTQSNESYEREVLNTSMLESNRVAGMIVSISENTINSDHFRAVQRRGTNIVFFDRVPSDIIASKVVCDDKKSAFNVVKFLINKGYKNIVHLGGPQTLLMSQERYNGYNEAMTQHFKDTPKVIFGGLHKMDGYNAMQIIKDDNIPCDCIFTVNDRVALGVYDFANENKIKIPDDLGVIGFHNNLYSSMLTPSLSTVEQHSFDVGKAAAEIILAEIKSEKTTNEFITVNNSLIIRDSI